ncbi:MAG: hypothetical protein JSS56_26160 [Proteobacteria bacterium]|nr:hypothetical protein [Pseudomonadota bacterium]
MKLRNIAIALCATAALTACGGGGGGNQGGGVSEFLKDPIGTTLNFALDGAFADIDGLTVESSGNTLKITDLGSSIFGTNTSIFGVGSLYVDDITCTDTSCTGQVAVPAEVNGVLQSVGREKATLTKAGDNFIVDSPSIGQRTFKPKTQSTGGATLTESASCSQWWDALTAGGGTWNAANPASNSASDYAPPKGTYHFSGASTWSVDEAADNRTPGAMYSTFVPTGTRLARIYEYQNYVATGKSWCVLHMDLDYTVYYPNGSPSGSYGPSNIDWILMSLSNGELVVKAGHNTIVATMPAGEYEMRLTK